MCSYNSINSVSIVDFVVDRVYGRVSVANADLR